ncbi:hypothetical protein D9757_007432 [Collybiopsis confluens]|uniref:Alpha/beta hydrolase fold-3 domain-containing protein n=1 Tax=Collybiopsis confluens TaxID=2823264 RepID=A0A8H5M792_9AGAR|nr:hypothetical protein D9757_007432 [Collybiopsis confluens]
MQANTSLVDGRAKFGAVSWKVKKSAYHKSTSLAFALALNMLRTPFSRVPHRYTAKPLKRRIADVAAQYLMANLSPSEVQCILGPSLLTYQRWAKRSKLDLIVEDLESSPDGGETRNGQLFWIGPKRTKKVILYLPPGAYYAPLIEPTLDFLRFMQLELNKQGIDVGIVTVLSYSLVPEAVFPTQLRQAIRALKRLFDMGCEPSDIQVLGESAGGNLVFQVLSHILHPLPSGGIPTLALPKGQGLNGACALSPWVSLSNPKQWGDSFVSKSQLDIMPPEIEDLGRAYLEHIPASSIAYAEPILAPNNWYSGLSKIVDRLFISAGEEERFRDQVVVFSEKIIKPHYQETILEVQAGGIHCDSLPDFAIWKNPPKNTLTEAVLKWIAEGFK